MNNRRSGDLHKRAVLHTRFYSTVQYGVTYSVHTVTLRNGGWVGELHSHPVTVTVTGFSFCLPVRSTIRSIHCRRNAPSGGGGGGGG